MKDENTNSNPFRELRQLSGMSQEAFSKYFKIPKRTIEEWDRGSRKCTLYLISLMKYKLEHEGKLNTKKGETT